MFAVCTDTAIDTYTFYFSIEHSISLNTTEFSLQWSLHTSAMPHRVPLTALV